MLTHIHASMGISPVQEMCLYLIDLQVYRQLVFSQLYLRQGEVKKKKIYTTSLHEPTGYKERVGESLKRL